MELGDGVLGRSTNEVKGNKAKGHNRVGGFCEKFWKTEIDSIHQVPVRKTEITFIILTASLHLGRLVEAGIGGLTK